MSDNIGIGTDKEGKTKEVSLEGHASSSSQTAVATGTTRPDVLTEGEPGKETQSGSTIRRPVYSGTPTKIGLRMGIFLFGVFVTRGDIELDRLLIPVEEASDYFPPFAHRQETYKEWIGISDPRHFDWKMMLRYDRSECSFVLSSEWKLFVASNHLGVMDLIRFYKPVPIKYDSDYFVQIVKRRDPNIIPEFKPENLLFELPLTGLGFWFRRLLIPGEDVRTHFPAVGIPSETHMIERLYFTDYLSDQWSIKIICYDVIYQLMIEEFMIAHDLGVGDVFVFYKPDHFLHSRHFLIGFRKGTGERRTLAATFALHNSPDRGGDGQGDGEGGGRTGGLKWWKLGFGGCCMARKSNTRICDQEM